MKELLERLISEMEDLFPDLRNRDIHLIPNPDLLPSGARFPCIGIKDGETKVSELPGETEELTLPVEIYIYDQLKPGNKYILAFLDRGQKIRARLRNNTLDGYVQGVSPQKETPLTLMEKTPGQVLRKGLFFQYEREA